MANNPFEDSRVSSGTLNRGGQKPGGNGATEESKAISRDDVRDGAQNPRIIVASALVGDRVYNPAGEDLGAIEEIALDIPDGRIAYAVLSFGGFLGIGNKLFAVPWSAMLPGLEEHRFILDIDRETLKNAPGFDKNNWPDLADPAFGEAIHKHYGAIPYWQHTFTDAGDYVGNDVRRNRSMEYEPTTGYQAGERH